MINIKYFLLFVVTAVALTSCGGTFANTTMKPVIEEVIFTTKPNISRHTLLSSASTITPLLHAMPGFISRTIAQGQKKNEWLDLVEWQSLKYAMSAAKKTGTNPLMQRFVSLMKTYKMYHFTVST